MRHDFHHTMIFHAHSEVNKPENLSTIFAQNLCFTLKFIHDNDVRKFLSFL